MLIKYGASRVGVHHTPFVDAPTRNPQVATDDAGTPATEVTADLRNNVVWNWGEGQGTRIQSAAWANAVNNLYSAPTLEAVWWTIRGVFDGEEFRSVAITPASYVTALYRAALGRDPDADGLAFYTAQVLAACDALVPFLVHSPEFATVRAQLTPAALVTRIFRQGLGRPRTDAELSRGVDYVVSTADITPGLTALLASDEYTATPRTFARHVRVLFRALLGREPGADELAGRVDHLAQRLAALGGRAAEVREFEARVTQTFRFR
jgi:hypothetical protein